MARYHAQQRLIAEKHLAAHNYGAFWPSGCASNCRFEEAPDSQCACDNAKQLPGRPVTMLLCVSMRAGHDGHLPTYFHDMRHARRAFGVDCKQHVVARRSDARIAWQRQPVSIARA